MTSITVLRPVLLALKLPCLFGEVLGGWPVQALEPTELDTEIVLVNGLRIPPEWLC